MGAGKGKSKRTQKIPRIADMSAAPKAKGKDETSDMLSRPLEVEKMILVEDGGQGGHFIAATLRTKQAYEYQEKVKLLYMQHRREAARQIVAAVERIGPKYLKQVFPLLEWLNEEDLEKTLSAHRRWWYDDALAFYEGLEEELKGGGLHLHLWEHVQTTLARLREEALVGPDDEDAAAIRVEDEDFGRVDF